MNSKEESSPILFLWIKPLPLNNIKPANSNAFPLLNLECKLQFQDVLKIVATEINVYLQTKLDFC